MKNEIFVKEKTMESRKNWLWALVTAFGLCVIFSSCFSTGSARGTLPQTAVTIQRVRVSSTFLGEVLGAENATMEIPMQVYIDNDKPFELANGEAKTILVNNGEHMVYAVLKDVESKSVLFTAKSKTIAVSIAPKKGILSKMILDIDVK